MKKRLISALLSIAMVATMAGCVTKNTDTSNAAIAPDEYQKTAETNAKVYKKFVTLPNYIGLEAGVDKSVLDITDEDVDKYINSVLESYATTENIETGVTKNGDDIILDYSGKLNGEAFSGGTATDVTYTIGSGMMIDDLDKGLAGLTVGQKYELPCKFPDSYSSKELAGKSVIFEVTVNAIVKTNIPELTDEWLVKNAEKLETTETTVEGFKKATREYLEAEAQTTYEESKFKAALVKIINDTKISKYPQKEIDSLKATWKKNVETEYETYKNYYSYLGIDSFTEFKKEVYECSTDTEFDSEATKQAQDYLLEKMIMTIIAVDNNITVSADEIKELGQEYAESYGYDSYEAIITEHGKIFNAELGYTVLGRKVMEFINEKSVEVEVESATSATETSTESSSK